METIPKQFVRKNPQEGPTSFDKKEDDVKDDDDPLSIRNTSLNILGSFLAFLTLVLPSLGVILDRSLLHEKGANPPQIIK